jgi:hypothetical protein
MSKIEKPAFIGGAIFCLMFLLALVAEIGGYATKEQVSQLASWSLVPIYGGFVISGFMWLRSRHQHGPIHLWASQLARRHLRVRGLFFIVFLFL